MVSQDRFPQFLGGISALGPQRLRELAARANVKVAASDDARRIATSLLARLEHADDLQHYDLTEAEVETIGVALGLGARAAWRPSVSVEEFERLPFYAKPSYDLDVWKALGAAASETAAKASPAAKAKAPAVAKPGAGRPVKTSAASRPAKAKAKAKATRAKQPAKGKARAPRVAPKAKSKSPAKRTSRR